MNTGDTHKFSRAGAWFEKRNAHVAKLWARCAPRPAAHVHPGAKDQKL